ncbi:MAG: C40 family peptidase [Candidatus Omnitrophica bacterium]|nr:C40 family peptidase [Candidatus Omnitrophota bacterium]
MKTKISLFILFFLVWVNAVFAEEAENKFLAVSAPVADIRKQPQDSKGGYEHDGLQQTQALFNEILLYKSSDNDWYYVEAVEQPEFTHNGQWQGYPGYIRKEKVKPVKKYPEYDMVVAVNSAEILDSPSLKAGVLLRVSIATKVKTIIKQKNFYKVEIQEGGFGWINKNDLMKLGKRVTRKGLIKTARLFLKNPYLWGGRSFFMPFLKDITTGVDCSGLVNLVYRANGMDIPRDAQEQWMLAEDITAEELRPADLIYISNKNRFDSIVHVMISLGGENFIEAPGTGNAVRINNFKNKFGMSLKELKEKKFITDGKKIYFRKVKDIKNKMG